MYRMALGDTYPLRALEAQRKIARVRALRARTRSFFEYLAPSGAKYCLKPTSEQAGIGPRRENCGFSESKKVKP